MDKVSPSGDLDKVPLELMRVRKTAERVKIKTFRGVAVAKGNQSYQIMRRTSCR